jgi:hypothetical protein
MGYAPEELSKSAFTPSSPHKQLKNNGIRMKPRFHTAFILLFGKKIINGSEKDYVLMTV